MANPIYTQANISEAGFKLMDQMLRPWRDKVILTLISLKDESKISAYLDKSLIPDPLPKEPYPLPEDYVFTKVTKDNGVFFFVVGKPVQRRPRGITSASLPIQEGDLIHLKSTQGTFKVVYANRDVIILTTKYLAKDYIATKAEHPNLIVNWTDFKCKEGNQ